MMDNKIEEKLYRETFGLSLPPSGTKVEIKFMAGIGHYILWPKCPDGEDIIESNFPNRRTATALAKKKGWVVK